MFCPTLRNGDYCLLRVLLYAGFSEILKIITCTRICRTVDTKTYMYRHIQITIVILQVPDTVLSLSTDVWHDECEANREGDSLVAPVMLCTRREGRSHAASPQDCTSPAMYIQPSIAHAVSADLPAHLSLPQPKLEGLVAQGEASSERMGSGL